MKVIAFDLGDTLVEYEGVPLSWEAHYPEALADLASTFGSVPSNRHLERASAVLRRYNTRINPREKEISFASILDELLLAFEHGQTLDELPSATAFFRVFRQKLRGFPDACPALSALRNRGIRIGVFTDVPYGMPRELVLEDVSRTAVAGYVDALVTSRDVGFRKPAPATLTFLAETLSCALRDLVYVGNEKKDVEVARACGCRSILIDRASHGLDWGQDRTIGLLSELLNGQAPTPPWPCGTKAANTAKVRARS